MIVTIDGKPVRRVDDLLNTLEQHRPGDVLTLGVQRDGAVSQVQVTLQAAN